jgi:SAM-dependent methyltransferase
MDDHIIERLLEINYQFYQSFAVEFSETRRRIQPGVLRVIEKLPQRMSLLDLGCGNGELATVLLERSFSGNYTGVDFCENLLEIASQAARSGLVSGPLEVRFLVADISQPGWSQIVQDSYYDQILAFAALHHVPGKARRYVLLQDIRNLLSPKGFFYLSVWQFLNSDRLRKRIIPWESVGITEDMVEEGDFLIDWRRGGSGIRYVHLFTSNDLQELASLNGFQVIDEFYSDGYEGRLGLYQIWRKM